MQRKENNPSRTALTRSDSNKSSNDTATALLLREIAKHDPISSFKVPAKAW